MNTRLPPLKRFGQNFLTDKNILKKISEVVRILPEDVVLEIGPGDGAMTFSLVSKAKKVLAIEIDRGRFKELKEKSKLVKNLDVRLGDFLKFDLVSAVRRNKIKDLVVVANIPYYITTPILERLFDNIGFIKDIYLTVQKEVGERFVAKPGTKAYGSLSCFVQYFTKPDILFPIKAGSFLPAPKVDSSFVRLTPYIRGERPWLVKNEKRLFEVMRAAFGQRRKTLASSLARVVDKDTLLRVSPHGVLLRRPETLEIADFIAIANQIER
jgi:16S rRNA (adenine1518-N6/adenine1519-N6)-dimethyltransferase